MAKKYRVKDAALDEYPELYALVRSTRKRVTLHGKAGTWQKPDTARGPGGTETVPPATQADLKALLEEGNPLIEEYDEADAKSAAPAETK